MGTLCVHFLKNKEMLRINLQADNLRHQMIHRLHQILTTCQAARCFLAIAEEFHHLRALSSLWLALPQQERERKPYAHITSLITFPKYKC
ncbi:hypothetical protein ACJW31_09G173500 [Castanea mollissima]